MLGYTHIAVLLLTMYILCWVLLFQNLYTFPSVSWTNNYALTVNACLQHTHVLTRFGCTY